MKKIHLALIVLGLSTLGLSAQKASKKKVRVKAAKIVEAVEAYPKSIVVDSNVRPDFQLVTLPYAEDALEPVISKQTIQLHHGKHLAGYVANLNKLRIEGKVGHQSLMEIVSSAKAGALFNNAGQTFNHNLYFTQFSPKPVHTEPQGLLKHLVEEKWGSFAEFQKEFEKAGMSVFGSGWVWLSVDINNQLQITTHAGGDGPLTKGFVPLMGIDVWEHAYYLDYQNKRADHLKAIWSIIDWSVVAERLKKSEGLFSGAIPMEKDAL